VRLEWIAIVKDTQALLRTELAKSAKTNESRLKLVGKRWRLIRGDGQTGGWGVFGSVSSLGFGEATSTNGLLLSCASTLFKSR